MVLLNEIKKEAERLRPGTLPAIPQPIYKEEPIYKKEPRKILGITLPFGTKRVKVEETRSLLEQLKEEAEKLRPMIVPEPTEEITNRKTTNSHREISL